MMGRKAREKAVRREWLARGNGEDTPRMTHQQAWHQVSQSKPRNVIVSNVESVVIVRAVDAEGNVVTRKKLASIPMLHNMHQYHELMAKHHQAMNIPSTHYRHRLTITGEKLVPDAGMFGTPKVMPVFKFRVVNCAMHRKQGQVFPRGKAYQRVMLRAMKQAMEARS